MMDPDEYGAELGKEARVWKVYVQETDKWDRELVDGWNKSLDVILVFAALFSAVSTTLLIESSGMLRQDPNDVSATALVAISQALVAIANNSFVDLANLTISHTDATASFRPSQHAVIINTLWYLSLSLSIATSLLVMLAKDWCHSFIANRTGHPWDQALRRQRKWTMIERWQMQELITVLPSLIHLSLLLFAVGLCIYVWDMNPTAAMPVMVLFKVRSRHVIATQFWLLLSLIGDSSTDLQKKLKSKIEEETELLIRGQGVDTIRVELEEEIIQGYWSGHHFGVYSARIIECILEGRNALSLNHLYQRIMQDLGDVPPNIRGRSSFLDPAVNLQPELTSRDAQPDLSSVPNTTILNPPAVDQWVRRLSAVESHSSLALYSPHALDTGLPSPATPIHISANEEPEETRARSTINHVIVPVLPGSMGSENA
ncbi:hypothetical protein RSOLAG22IIIB_11783 [Rhizoctonia solani]|uniref:DUF6535 domain-containing protein n=1 Tax=Rhizoctonia solani TaxID=456999 RepID=A0A0K6GAM0_9AGAM|nr:hypothetical protein RSOLAG22IIIB_11783 [Rhizoctonia solani]